jgi:hypothetical protein
MAPDGPPPAVLPEVTESLDAPPPISTAGEQGEDAVPIITPPPEQPPVDEGS